MKILMSLLFVTGLVMAQARVETFIIQIRDRSMSVFSPEKVKKKFTVLVENQSLSDQVVKLTVKGKILKYVSINSGRTESVEIENNTTSNVVFVPVSPAFQEAELIFGKKAYEIPSKK